MGFLADLLARGRALLGPRPPEGTATDAVRHDRFDAAVFDELAAGVPALRRLTDELALHHDFARDLVRDTVLQFYKSDPQLRDRAEMDRRCHGNHAVAEHVAASPDAQRLRAYTRHDSYGAAMAAIGVSEQVRQILDAQPDAAETARAEQRAQAERGAAQHALRVCLDAAAATSGDYDGEGPLTEAQQRAADALSQAAAATAQAQARSEQARADADRERAAFAAAARKPVEQAVTDAAERLAEEAELLRAWGVEPGVVQKLPYAERAALVAALRRNRIAQFSKLLGRFRLMAAGERAHKVVYGRDEVIAVTLSDRLPNMVGSELAALANPHLRRSLLARLVEGQVLTYDHQGTERVGQGAIVCCVDTSGSMTMPDPAGVTREAWSKAFALALLDQPRAAGRDFVGVLFSSRHQQKVYRFPAGRGPIEDVLGFVETFFDGGTDFMAPLDLAAQLLDDEFTATGRKAADVVFITDDDCQVTADWQRAFLDTKHRLGFRLFGVTVGCPAGGPLHALSDNARSITEFTDPPGVADIFRMV